MFDEEFITNAINRSTENATDRRRFLKAAGMVGLGGAGVAAGLGSTPAFADDTSGPSDPAILNFALNLEYLEAEFYSLAVTGQPLPGNLTDGTGNQGGVRGGHQVRFQTAVGRGIAREIAADERDHVKFLRNALKSSAVAQPKIDLQQSFTSAARAAGLIGPHQHFDPFACEDNFFLAAFIFEDVGVTAYKGAAPFISNKTYLSAAAGILAVEAYHAATIRTVLYERGLATSANKISDARDSLDGPSDDDQGIVMDGRINIVPTDQDGIAFGRTPQQVLNVVYLTPNQATSGGFFPRGVNGSINTSG